MEPIIYKSIRLLNTSSVVSKTNGETILRQLMSVSRSLDNVTGNACRHDLCNYVFVGEPDNKTVLRSVVLVLVLVDETDPCSVVSLTICTKMNKPIRTTTITIQRK